MSIELSFFDWKGRTVAVGFVLMAACSALAGTSNGQPVLVGQTPKAAVAKSTNAQMTWTSETGHMKKMSSSEIDDLAKKLRMELERTFDELRSVALHREADMTASVTAYVSAGMAFDDAEEILKAAGFDVRPRPGPREAEDINRPTDWYAVHARIANFARRGLGTVDVFVDLFPRSPGDFTILKGVKATLYIDSL